MTTEKLQEKLARNLDNKEIAGICAGISDYSGAEPWLVRLFFLGSLFFGGTGLLVYLLLWIFMPVQRKEAL